MFSLIRPAKVEGHSVSAGHIHHSQGGKLLQLLREGEPVEFQKSEKQKRGGLHLPGSHTDAGEARGRSQGGRSQR